MAESIPAAPGGIFLSYRRDDTEFPAGWLYEHLVARFGREQVFRDVDSIELGDDFAKVIAERVGACDVLLALIGSQWLTFTDEAGRRRLDNPEDFVRLEIEAALERKVRVIPILVGNARMPRVEQVPGSLGKLLRHQALELSPNRFESDTGRLLTVLTNTLAEAQAERHAEEQVRREAEKAERKPSDERSAYPPETGHPRGSGPDQQDSGVHSGPTPRRGSSGPTLRRGSSGPPVRRLQRILVMIKGLDFTEIDGIFGPRTEEAIRSFQNANGLSADGIVGPKTWAALPTDPDTPKLALGATGPVVTALQQALRDFGGVGMPTDPGTADGTFGRRTEAAVRAYQADRGLSVDGIVGDRTWWVPAGAAGATLASLAGLTT